jgi:hypothetical protein
MAGPGALLLMPRRVREPIKIAADFKKILVDMNKSM